MAYRSARCGYHGAMVGFPAARLADPTTHDLLVPSGVIGPPVTPPTQGPVLIEGLPAAYVTCTVVCAGTTSFGPAHPPPPPGTPVPIVMGTTSVLINGKPAARWAPSGDIGACGVFLGDAKLAAARTVLIGGPSVGPAGLPFKRLPNGDLQLGNAIIIEGSEEFQARVAARLLTVASVPSGVAMLGLVDGSGKSMTIKEFTGPNSFAGPHSFEDATAAGQPVFDGAGQPINTWLGLGPQATGTGQGSDVTLEYNPTLTLPNPADPANPMPSDAVLFHEMNHGQHQMRSTYDGSPKAGWTTQEEQNTISTGVPSEASYLKEQGYPWQRADHDTTFVPNP
jgi:uncharacterized Zn-binding protein involved in type VI secretion